MIAILAAMPQEVQALCAVLESAQPVQVAGRDFQRGSLWGKDVVVGFSRWGKVAAAASAAATLATFKPSRLIFCGIAGSLRDDLHPGDVVVARKLYQHDLDASPFFAPMHVPLLNLAALPTDEALSKDLYAAAQVFLAEDFEGLPEKYELELNGDTPRRAVRGDIATGDCIVASRERKSLVRRMVPTAACVEMEGAAAAQVCHESGVPYACLRMISDLADESLDEKRVLTMAGFSGACFALMLRRYLLG
jgi:adenosylhomocysteine nucleosidase